MIIEDTIRQSAALRGQGKFQDAIDLVEAAMKAGSPQDDLWFNANHEGFLAAKEAGLTEKAKGFAAEIRKEHPDLPGIQGY